MSRSPGYTITSLSSSITQRVFCNSKVAPFQLGVNSAAQLRLYAASALTSFPGPSEPKQDDQTVDTVGLSLLAYYKFDAMTSGEAVIRMNNWEGPTAKMPDPADFAGTNNPGYVTDPTQVPKSTCGAMVPNLYRGYPGAAHLYWFTGSVAPYVGKNAYLMSSSQVHPGADGEYWECYRQQYASSHGLGLAFPSPGEDSSVATTYAPLDTDFSLSMWYKLDRKPWGAEGYYRDYGNTAPFCIAASGMGNLTGYSYCGITFGSSSVRNKYFMSLGYQNTRYNGTNWHVYSDAGGNASAIIDTGSWHHIVLSVSGATYDNRTASFYLDGLPLTCSRVDGSVPGTTTMTKDFDYSTTIATEGNTDLRFLLFNDLRPSARMQYGFVGGITEFAYFNDALTQGQVTQLYNDGTGSDATDLLPIVCPSRCIPSS